MSKQRCFPADLSDITATRALVSSDLIELERMAVERVRRARVKAPESAILAWVRSIGPESVLSAKLTDIRAIANAF